MNGILTEFAASILVKQLVYAAKAMNPIIDSVQTKNEDVKVKSEIKVHGNISEDIQDESDQEELINEQDIKVEEGTEKPDKKGKEPNRLRGEKSLKM